MAQNRRARHDYEILDTFEAGLELHGGEVKSVRAGHLSIAEAYVSVRRGEAWLLQSYIKPYEQAGHAADEPTRDRKLLLHKEELAQLASKSREKQLTIIPLSAYLKRGYVKIEIALARGKQLHDKRATLKAKEQAREAARAVRDFEKS